MAQQHGFFDPERGQQCGQHFPRFPVHVVGAQPAFASNVWHRIGLAITLPGVDNAGAACRCTNGGGPVPPHRDRAQPFMQEDDGRQRPVREPRQALNLESHAVDLKLFHGGNGTGYPRRMSLLLDSFWRAVAYCLHPRVIALSFLPLLIMVALSLGLGYFFWESAVEWRARDGSSPREL